MIENKNETETENLMQDVGSLDEEFPEKTKTVNLVSQDGTRFTLSSKVAFMSTFIKTALEETEDMQVTLKEVSTELLELVIEYMKHHKGVEQPIIEKPLKSNVMKEVCADSWDADFIDTVDKKNGREKLYKLIAAANYLDIKSLLHLGCAKVASLIKDQPLEKIKDILNPGSEYVKDTEKKEETKE